MGIDPEIVARQLMFDGDSPRVAALDQNSFRGSVIVLCPFVEFRSRRIEVGEGANLETIFSPSRQV